MKYEEACSRGAVTTEQFKQIMANASASAKEYAIETKGVAGSTDVFVNKQKESISAMQASTKATVGTGTALKTLGRTLVSMGAYTLIFTVISKVVGLAATAIDNYVHRVEKANDAMDEAVSTYEETKSELENINSELDTNKQKIDELLSKDKLTYAEKGQLEELQEITKELEFQADIKQRKLENDQKNSANKAVKAYEKQYGDEDITENRIQKKVKFAKNTGNTGVSKGDNDIVGNVAELQIFKSLLEDTEKELKNTSGMTDDEINSLNEDFQSYIDIISDTEDKLNSSLSDLESKRSAMEEQYKAAIDKKNSGALLSTDDKNIISTYEEILNAIELIYKYLDPNKYRDMQMSSIFDTEGIEKSKDELIEMAKAGKLDESTINGYKNLKTAMDENGVSAKDLCDDIYALADAEKATSDAVNKTSVSSFSDVWNSADFSDAKDKLLELAKSGEISSETIKSTEEYRKLIDDTGLSAETAKNRITEMLSVQEKLSAASQGIEKLKSSYEEFKNIGFVTAQTLESLPDVFKRLPSFNIFEKIVGNPESGKEKIQQAFNDIVKSYLLEENTLSGLVNASNSEVQTYIANLKQMGITNAEEIVKQAQKALNENNRLINAAELEYEKAHLNYINGKSKMDADYLTKVASKNSQLASALGSAYKTDYDNWCELLSQKAKAYNDFVTACGSSYDKSKGITENVNAAMANGVNAAYVNEQASRYINAKLDAKEASNKLKLDLKTIKVNFKSNYSPSTSGSGSSGSGSNKGSSAKGSKGTKEAKKATAELFDFVERRLKKLETAVDKAKGKIDELFNRKSKNNQIDKAIKATTNLINAELKAAKKYQAYADKIAGKAKKTSKQTVKISDSAGKAIVGSAKKYVGKLNYVWGGSSLVTGADCSGFTQQIFKKNGINIARTAQAQYNTTKGTKVTNKSKLKPGDLVFFGSSAKNISHVGIYAGDGKYVHSPHRGEKVKVSNLSGRKDFVGGVRASALNKTTTKTYKVKGLPSAIVKKYIKLIKNGSLTKDGLKSIKNEKLKKFINDYLTWYDKAQDHTTKAEELKAQKRQYQLDKYQNYVDEAQTYIDKYNTQIELAPGAATKNVIEQKKLKYVKQLYDKQIDIAKLEKDSLKVAQLRVEKEKELLAVKKEIRQNSLDQIDKDETLLDAQYKNATSTKSKNSILQKKNKQNDKKVTVNKNYYNSVSKEFTSKGKTASKATTKAKSLSNSDRKKINSYIKRGKTIPKSLLKKVKSVDGNLYNSLVNYNKMCDNGSSIINLLRKSKISKKTKDNIKKAISSGKPISKSTLKIIKKQAPDLYKKAVKWNKGIPNRDNISKKISSTKSLTSSDKKKINSLIKSKKRIPSDLMKKVKAANPGLYKQLLEYNRYYDYTKDAKYDWDLSKEESKTEKREDFKEQFDNIQTEHERRVAKINDQISSTENDISLIEAKGGKASEDFYKSLSDLSGESKTELEGELSSLEKKLKDGLANGTIQEGTDEWYAMVDAIAEVKKNIESATLSTEQYLQKVRETHFEVSQHARDAISALNDEADFYKEILGYKKMYDKAGNLTDEGKSTMGLSLTKMNNFVVLNKKINEDLKENEELFKSSQIGYDEYIERKNNLISQQRDVIKGYYSEIEAIKNLINQGYDKQKDALSDLINKYKKALSAEKELHDYEKNVKDQTKNIDSLKKRIAALQGNETEEARQKISQLTISLKDAEENLQETQYDKYISDQEDILDDLQDSYEKFIEEEIDNLDETVQNFIKSASEDASMINNTLETIAEIANKWGLTIGDMNNPEGAYDYDKEHSTNDSTNIDNNDYQKGGSSGSAVNPNPERVITRNKFNDFMNNNKSDSYTSKDLDNLLPIQKLILAYSGGKLYYGQDKLSKLLDTLGTNNPSVAANMFSTAFGTSISDANDAVYKIQKDTQQKEAYERDEKVRTEAEKKAIEESKKRDAKMDKLKEIDEFLNDHVDEASQKKEKYGTLNQYIYGKTGGKVLSKENEKQLAKILGVKLKTDLTGKDGAEELKKIRDALKNAGFSTGGAIEGNTSGDTLLLRAARKERVLTPEQNKNWEKWTDAIPSIVGLADYLPKFNIPDISKFNGGDNVSIGDINIKLDGTNVTDADSLIKELQNSNKLRECIQDISINARRGNKLSIMKY